MLRTTPRRTQRAYDQLAVGTSTGTTAFSAGEARGAQDKAQHGPSGVAAPGLSSRWPSGRRTPGGRRPRRRWGWEVDPKEKEQRRRKEDKAMGKPRRTRTGGEGTQGGDRETCQLPQKSLFAEYQAETIRFKSTKSHEILPRVWNTEEQQYPGFLFPLFPRRSPGRQSAHTPFSALTRAR